MAKGREIVEVPLDNLVIAKGQVRTKDIQKGIDDLAQSIRIQGLLEPIVVCESEKPGKYEVLAGQRRFLAVKLLGWETIEAVKHERKGEIQNKVLSLTENLMRRDVSQREKIDACTDLFRKYDSIKGVVEATGLPYREVSQYVKFDRLVTPLKKLVENGEVNVNVALKAQDAATSEDGVVDPDDALRFAKEMAPMTGNQRKRLVEIRQEDPDTDPDDAIEKAKTGPKSEQIIVTISSGVKKSLRAYADDEKMTQDEAAATLIEEGLAGKGFGE